MENKCILCNNLPNTNYTIYVHKWREYGGYSKYEYPRYICSKECLTEFENNYKCNFCSMVCYDWRNYKKGDDGFTYCNDDETTIDNTKCYNLHMQNFDN